MIEITYYKEHNRVTISGHAGQAEEGQDIVCSAVSILAVTIGENIEKGSAELSCKPNHKFKSTVSLIFNALCAGFEIMAREAPEYVRYDKRG